MSVPCPKCGADSDDVGSKYVCGECYNVFDKGSVAAVPMRSIDVPTPQRPTMAKEQPRPAALVPPPTPVPAAAAAAAAPTLCPKCSGNLVSIGGKLVCEKCFHTVDTPEPSLTPAAPVAPAAQPAATPRPAAPAPVLAPTPAVAPNLAPAAVTVCPKCSGNLVDISGKFVCEKCFHTVDTPEPSPGSPASRPMAQPVISVAPSASAAPYAPAPASPAMASPTSALGAVCPKCSGNLMDISGKFVCEQCYHVVDTPGSASAAAKPSPFSKPAAPAFTAPTICPKCSGKLMDVDGRFVCDACYHVVDTPGPSASQKSSFTPRPTESIDDTQISPQMIGGIALILLLVLMIVVLAIRH